VPIATAGKIVKVSLPEITAQYQSENAFPGNLKKKPDADAALGIRSLR
jgi:hypothetical protein